MKELPDSLTFPFNFMHKIPTVLFRTEPQSGAMYFTELFLSFLVHSTPLETTHVQWFQTLTNNETLLLHNRTNEPIDRFNYKKFVYTYSFKAMKCSAFWFEFFH
jgi:hypothetical protein